MLCSSNPVIIEGTEVKGQVQRAFVHLDSTISDSFFYRQPFPFITAFKERSTKD